jgi:hypothetical protein
MTIFGRLFLIVPWSMEYSGTSTHAAVSRVRGSDAIKMDVAFSDPPVICHSPSCRP